MDIQQSELERANVFRVRSRFREYHVEFVDDAVLAMRAEIEDSAIIVADQGAREWAARLLHEIPSHRLIEVAAHEDSKTLEGARILIDQLIDRDFRVNQRLVAVGGGVVQDLVAFTASIIYRGVDWVFFPTTLLAQADSCIGSKTSINVGHRKNMAGNFYPPNRVVVDTAFLETLEPDEIRSGIGEILHFLIYANSAFLDRLLGEYDLLIGDRSRLLPYIRESLAIKRQVAETDELDKGERKKFNYGHTFGHALESLTDYGIKHGLAVTAGMDLANYVSLQLGMLSLPQYEELRRILEINFPVWNWGSLDLDKYLELLSKDKKNVSSDLTCILCAGRGKLVKYQIPLDAKLREWIAAHFATLSVT